jgi:hypothetical protein
VETLPAPTGALLDPSAFMPAKIGQLVDIQDIQLTAGGAAGINGTTGSFSGFDPYTTAPHIASSRYAEQGRILELGVTNASSAHHPFHLHGFSMQPISLRVTGAAGPPIFSWPYREFVDVIDVPAGHTLTFRVRLDDHRELADGMTLGGALGRWLFHCHIFFHAHSGMISELVTTAADGSEKPNVDVGGSWAYTAAGGTATRKGTFSHPDGDAVTLSESLGKVTDTGGGTWAWELDSTGLPDQTTYVYITATDASGRQDQTVFRLRIGGADDGSDSGDPHIRTVDGGRYDFQAVGEFMLLRDREGLEIQTRQTPVATQHPITDSHTGLTSCVSVNTAVAARVGAHSISYQPGRERGQLEFYLDGKPARLSSEGFDLEGDRVSAFDADGATGLRVDYAHQAVLTVTPRFWTSHNIWYMNVSVSRTQANEGLMGPIPKSTWLPRLPNGATVGPMPQSLHERYVALYRTFADGWRVTDATSLFVYVPGTSTATFSDPDWPAEKPPCKLKPQFELPGAPLLTGMPIADAERVCQGVAIDDLHRDCVFDVATTGDETFAKGYLVAQDMRLNGTGVQVKGNRPRTRRGETLVISATVRALAAGRPIPTGRVTFFVDGVAAGAPVELNTKGRASFSTNRLEVGAHKIRASYESSGSESAYHSSSSPNLLHTVEAGPGVPDPDSGHGHWPLWVWILIVLALIFIALMAFTS